MCGKKLFFKFKNLLKFSVDLKPIVPAILYKDILQAKKSTDQSTETKPEEELKSANEDEAFEDEEIDEQILENEDIAPPDIEGWYFKDTKHGTNSIKSEIMGLIY